MRLTLVLARVPAAALATVAAGCAALELSFPLAGTIAACFAAVLCGARPALVAACLALAVRLALPDPAWPPLPPVRDAVAAPVFRAIPEPEAGIAVGSLLGGRGALPRDVFDAFTRTGTSHLLAVSGFNITIAAGGLGFALRPFGARSAALATFSAAAALAVIAGLGPSVARASLMASVATVGTLLGRPSLALNALGAAAFVLLLVDPRAIEDPGFVLSVTATCGLVLVGRRLEEKLPGPRWLRAQLAATLAATLASLPVSTQLFGRVPLISPIVNLAVAPLIPPLMAAVGIGVVLAPLAPPLALPAEWAAYVFAKLLRSIVESAAALPMATVAVPHGGALVAGLYGFGALAWWGRPALRAPSRWPPVAGGLGAALLLATAIWPPATPRLVALSVGQGDAFLVEAGSARLLVDGGPDRNGVLRALGEALPFWSRRIDVVALTHAHADHANGLIAVVERFEIGLALEPEGIDPGELTDSWHAALARRGIELRSVRRGDRVRFGELVVDVLAPMPGSADPLANLVLRVRAGPLVALFLGDATERGQAALLLQPDALRASVYVPPHHGAATPHADALAAAVRPTVALFSVGANNRYGHPTPQALRALEGVRIMRTDRDGTLEVVVDGRSLVCRTRASALLRVWSGWLSRPAPCARPRRSARPRRGPDRERSRGRCARRPTGRRERRLAVGARRWTWRRAPRRPQRRPLRRGRGPSGDRGRGRPGTAGRLLPARASARRRGGLRGRGDARTVGRRPWGERRGCAAACCERARRHGGGAAAAR